MLPRMMPKYDGDDDDRSVHDHEPDISTADLKANHRAYSYTDLETAKGKGTLGSTQRHPTTYIHTHHQPSHSHSVTKIHIPSSLSSTVRKPVFPADPLVQTRGTTQSDLGRTPEYLQHTAVSRWRPDGENFGDGEVNKPLQKEELPIPPELSSGAGSDHTMTWKEKIVEGSSRKYDNGAAGYQSIGAPPKVKETMPTVKGAAPKVKGTTTKCSCTEYPQPGNGEEQEILATTSTVTLRKTETANLLQAWDLWVKQYLRGVLEASKEDERQEEGETTNHASAARSHSPLSSYSSDETILMPTLVLNPQTLTPIARPTSRLQVRNLPNSTPSIHNTITMSSAPSHPPNTPRRMIFNTLPDNLNLPGSPSQTPIVTLPSLPTISASISLSTPNTTSLPGGYSGLNLDFAFPPFPFYGKILCTAILALATSWLVLVYLVNFPESVLLRWTGQRTDERRKKTKVKGKNNARWGWSWLRRSFNISWLWTSEGGKIKKIGNLDEPSKYERLPTEIPNEIPPSSASSTLSSAALSTAFSPKPSDAGIPLRRRPRHSYPPAQHHTTSTSAPAAPNTTTIQTPNRNRKGNRSPSPENPFIPPIPPLHRRTSAEWLQNRMQFLLGSGVGVDVRDISPAPPINTQRPTTQPVLPPPTHPPTTQPISSKPPSYDPESQLALPPTLSSASNTPSKRSSMFAATPLSWYSHSHSDENLIASAGDVGGVGDGDIYRDGSWLDTFDNAVNKVVNGIVRFTQDGGEEGVILPVRR